MTIIKLGPPDLHLLCIVYDSFPHMISSGVLLTI
jgi:hypothetical protein